jgi:putative glutamine amidotransferase
VNSLPRPRIGITCGRIGQPLNRQHLYGEAITRAGGDPQYLYTDICREFPVDSLNGLLIPGGRDIDPERYGEPRLCYSHPAIYPEDDDRIAYELELLGIFLGYNKPVFGICYGMQLINIFFGGSLYPDIDSPLPGALDHCSGQHDITVCANPSNTSKAYLPIGTWTVNSSHHQAIDRLGDKIGDGLTAAAFSPDGIIEAVCSVRSRFLFGVQWHPERLPGPLSDLLFELFVSACKPA